jgi:hypothetical protein
LNTIRRTALGVLVLVLLIGGGLWVRERQAIKTGGADRTAPPDVTRADAVVDTDNVRVTLSLSPRPPIGFKKFKTRVRLEARSFLPGTPVLQNPRISFEMAMPMGDNRYALKPAPDGWLEAEVLLPSCGSGDPHWFAIIEGTRDGKPLTVRFRFDLSPGDES